MSFPYEKGDTWRAWVLIAITNALSFQKEFFGDTIKWLSIKKFKRDFHLFVAPPQPLPQSGRGWGGAFRLCLKGF
jgi:hypothetical protein